MYRGNRPKHQDDKKFKKVIVFSYRQDDTQKPQIPQRNCTPHPLPLKFEILVTMTRQCLTPQFEILVTITSLWIDYEIRNFIMY